LIEFKVKLSDHSSQLIENARVKFQEAAKYRFSDFNRYIYTLNEFYATETERRVKNLRKIQANIEYQRSVLAHISSRESVVDFMVDWCWTYDPRNANIGLPPSIPWVPWKRQIEFIEWFYNLYLNEKGGLVDKSRDQGATWLFCLIFLQEWRWVKGFAAGIGSNKLDNVDKRDSPDCIFEKLRTLMRYLPKWWFPHEWDARKHDKIANLINPENGANISGQGGKDIGRGGRRSVYMVDEAAALEFPKAADAALSQNTNSQFDLSTPRGMNHFGQKRHSGRVSVFSFAWQTDPRKNMEWYEKEVARLDPVVVAQELDRDYYASVDGLFIEPKWVRAAINFPLEPVGIRSAGLDVAAGGGNKSALVIRAGPVARVFTYNIENAVDLVHESFEKCNEAEVEFLNYDRIGVGHAVYSVANRTEREINFAHYGLESGDSPSDRFYEEYNKYAKDIFFNARAEWWYNLAKRFKNTYEHRNNKKHFEPDEMISIEDNDSLVAQLSSPMKMTTETGKIKCESKQQMRKRGIESPDEADAMVYAFAEKDGGNVHAVGGYSNVSDIYEEFVIEDKPTKHLQHNFGAICQMENLEIHGLFSIWNEVEGKLYIYDEYTASNPLASSVAKVLCDTMRMREYVLDKLMGNDFMFAEGKRTMVKEINGALWKLTQARQNVKIRQQKKFDPHGSLAILNELVESGKIVINIKCKELHQQMSFWRLEKGKLKNEGMREAILMLVSELKQVVPLEEMLKKMEYVTHIKEKLAPGVSIP
jgi:hypothetical protein